MASILTKGTLNMRLKKFGFFEQLPKDERSSVVSSLCALEHYDKKKLVGYLRTCPILILSAGIAVDVLSKMGEKIGPAH